MTSKLPSATAGVVDELYPLRTPIVHIGDVNPGIWPYLKPKLRDLVVGLIDFQELPNDETSYRLVFSDVGLANRAVAVLNYHYAIWELGGYYCAPGDTGEPEMERSFTTRIMTGRGFVGPRASQPRPRWMEELRSVFDHPAPWPDDAPSPEDVYDACLAFGPVFSVIMRPHEKPYDPLWSAEVQFFSPDDAAKLEEHARTSGFCGWKVTCRMLEHEARRDVIQAKVAAFEANVAAWTGPIVLETAKSLWPLEEQWHPNAMSDESSAPPEDACAEQDSQPLCTPVALSESGSEILDSEEWVVVDSLESQASGHHD